MRIPKEITFLAKQIHHEYTKDVCEGKNLRTEEKPSFVYLCICVSGQRAIPEICEILSDDLPCIPGFKNQLMFPDVTV